MNNLIRFGLWNFDLLNFKTQKYGILIYKSGYMFDFNLIL